MSIFFSSCVSAVSARSIRSCAISWSRSWFAHAQGAGRTAPPCPDRAGPKGAEGRGPPAVVRGGMCAHGAPHRSSKVRIGRDWTVCRGVFTCLPSRSARTRAMVATAASHRRVWL